MGRVNCPLCKGPFRPKDGTQLIRKPRVNKEQRGGRGPPVFTNEVLPHLHGNEHPILLSHVFWFSMVKLKINYIVK